MPLIVALYTSAWIEICPVLGCIDGLNVALYTSAWIEIPGNAMQFAWLKRRTLHECVD